jgi:chromate reductase
MPSRADTSRVLAVAGSLRRASFNGRLVAAASSLAPQGMRIDIYDDLASVPLFNEDLESPRAPAGVENLRTAIARSDALLISTPEYNQSLPGVVKNMVDWLSRGEPVVLENKPVAILGVTAGNWGTRLAQAALRHTLTACGALIMPTPQVYLRDAAQLFDVGGRLTNAPARDALGDFLAAFDRWLRYGR